MSVATTVDQPEKRTRKRRVVPDPASAEQVTATVPKRMTGRLPRTAMSDSHKAALAEGREHGRAVRLYLEAVEGLQAPRRRGRRRTPESIEKRLGTIDEVLGSADALTRLHLTQERINLEAELTRVAGAHRDTDITELEDAFVDAAGAYSKRKGISWTTWRAMGVQPEVLKRAGITRS